MLGRMRRRRRKMGSVDLDITAFLNLMVILIPFLLITAVFSRVTVLDLYLPPASSEESKTKNPFQLEIVIRSKVLEVRERGSGYRRKIESDANGFDYQKLSGLVFQLKQRFPKRKAASILAEPDIEYDTLVQVMDVVRMRAQKKNGESTFDEMFPEISIGDAPRGSS